VSARVAPIVAAALALAGCAALRPIVAPPDDQAAYRETRVAETIDDRLAAAEAYLERYPEGLHLAEVRAYFERAEPVLFEARRGSAGGLESYLRALPHGPHAREALALLRGLREARDTPDEAGRQASATEARLARAAAKRAAARDAVAAWVGRFLDPAAWRGPLASAPAELVVPWSLGLPAPACREADAGEAASADEGAPAKRPAGARRCTKMVEVEYPVLVGTTVEPRQITLQIDADQDAEGRLVAVTLGGPELFLRLEETHAVRAIDSKDGGRRIDAIARQVEAVRAEFGSRVSKAPECAHRAVAPTVLALACAGLSVVVHAGEGTEDDSISVRAIDR
jgi:hypothetical protein